MQFLFLCNGSFHVIFCRVRGEAPWGSAWWRLCHSGAGPPPYGMLAVTRADTAPSRLLPAPPERSRALRPTRPGVPVVWQARALRRRDPLAPWRPHCCSLLSPPPDRDPTCPQLGDPQLNRCSVKSEERPPAPSAVWPAIPGVQRRELGVDEATGAAAKGGPSADSCQ